MQILPKKYLKHKSVCSEQQVYTSQENFTQPLDVMVETFSRSAGDTSFIFLIIYFILNLFLDKVVKLVVGGSVINRAYTEKKKEKKIKKKEYWTLQEILPRVIVFFLLFLLFHLGR